MVWQEPNYIFYEIKRGKPLLDILIKRKGDLRNKKEIKKIN
jgi:hypothetical protein